MASLRLPTLWYETCTTTGIWDVEEDQTIRPFALWFDVVRYQKAGDIDTADAATDILACVDGPN